MRRLVALGSVLALAVACAPAEVDVPLDSDEDGLMDAEEQELGLDPASPDSDGDGYLDLDEIESNTDPINPEDHPYLGGWPMDACAATVVSTGNAQGNVANGFEAMDQFGETVNLYDFCDRGVLLISAAFW